jgi:hypothetical protein
MSLQQSWHHLQQQQTALEVADGETAAAVWEQAALAAAAANAAGDGGGETAAAAARTGWLQSRHERKTAEQGNHLILGWLMDQNGIGAGAGGYDTTDATAVQQLSSAHAGARAAAAAAARAATYSNEKDADSTAATARAAAAAPMVSALEVLVVQPILAQQRLTTVACWSLLLQEHQLLQRLSAIQGLFFQQQGDWVVLLCDALEPLLLQQQQRAADAVADRGVQQGLISPVVLQLLLESAVQQSCLAGVPDAERLSLQVRGPVLLRLHGSGQSHEHPVKEPNVGSWGCYIIKLLYLNTTLQQYRETIIIAFVLFSICGQCGAAGPDLYVLDEFFLAWFACPAPPAEIRCGFLLPQRRRLLERLSLAGAKPHQQTEAAAVAAAAAPPSVWQQQQGLQTVCTWVMTSPGLSVCC